MELRWLKENLQIFTFQIKICTFHQIFKTKLKSNTSPLSYFCIDKSQGHTVYSFWINTFKTLKYPWYTYQINSSDKKSVIGLRLAPECCQKSLHVISNTGEASASIVKKQHNFWRGRDAELFLNRWLLTFPPMGKMN